MLLLLYVYGVGDVNSLLCDVAVALIVYVWVGMLVHCYVMKVLLSLYVCVGGDVSSLLCDVGVALILCMCGWGC